MHPGTQQSQGASGLMGQAENLVAGQKHHPGAQQSQSASGLAGNASRNVAAGQTVPPAKTHKSFGQKISDFFK